MVSVTINSRINKKRREPHRPKFGSLPIHQQDPKRIRHIPMIRPFTVFCKLNQISFSDRQWFEQEAGSLSHTDGACPVCHAKACLSPFASYTRYLVEWKDGSPATQEVNIQRYQCSSCGHTHALLPSPLVPYSSYSLRFILTVLRNYFLHRACVQEICKHAGIAISTLYRWKALFLAHKALWLGVLEGLETSAGTFLEGMNGTLLMEFFHQFLFSFLQHLRGRSANPPPGPPGQASGST